MADAAVTTTDVAGLLSCSCFAAAAVMAAAASALAADAAAKADAAPSSGFYLSFAAVAADSNPSTTDNCRYRIASSSVSAIPKLPFTMVLGQFPAACGGVVGYFKPIPRCPYREIKWQRKALYNLSRYCICSTGLSL